MFARFAHYENLEPYDAGILVINLAARVVAADSTYSLLARNGSVRVSGEVAENNEDKNEDVYVPYRPLE